jgi:hypothetical protein
MLISGPNRSEVGVVTVPLHGIAAVAESLQIRYLVVAAFIPWSDVVDLQRAFVCWNATKLTTKPCAFQNLVSKGPANIARASSAVLPDQVSPLIDIFSEFPVASILKLLYLQRCELVVSKEFVVRSFAFHDLPICKDPTNHVPCYFRIVIELAAILVEERASYVFTTGTPPSI